MDDYKVGYNFSNTVIVQAKTHKEAAIIYYNQFPTNEDKWIGVLGKGFKIVKNLIWYRTVELFPQQINIRYGNKDFDDRKLDSYSWKLLDLVKKNNPEWLKNIVNCEDGFIISIQNPFQNNHPLEISTAGIDSDLIIFGLAWMDWYELRYYSDLTWFEWKRNDAAVFETIELVVNAIIEEELISANAKKTKGIGSVNGRFLSEEEYNLTFEQNTLLQAISWKGTYNYPKNG